VAYDDYICKRNECIVNNFQSSCTVVEDVDVERIELSVEKLKFGKAGGPDELCAESIHYAHPVLMMHIKHRFKLILMHGYVPHDYGLGISVPLVKDKAGNINNVDYCAITLSHFTQFYALNIFVTLRFVKVLIKFY